MNPFQTLSVGRREPRTEMNGQISRMLVQYQHCAAMFSNAGPVSACTLEQRPHAASAPIVQARAEPSVVWASGCRARSNFPSARVHRPRASSVVVQRSRRGGMENRGTKRKSRRILPKLAVSRHRCSAHCTNGRRLKQIPAIRNCGSQPAPELSSQPLRSLAHQFAVREFSGVGCIAVPGIPNSLGRWTHCLSVSGELRSSLCDERRNLFGVHRVTPGKVKEISR